MREEQTQGVVVAVEGNMATVKLPKPQACGSCGGEGSCCSGLTASGDVTVRATNEPGARLGEVVDVLLVQESSSKAVSILYLFPLTAMVLGAILGSWLHPLGDPEISAVVLSLVCLGAAFGLIGWRSSRTRDREIPPRIISVHRSHSSSRPT